MTASAILQLDLIITVDTAVAHLAGALGKQVWTLIPFIPDWRWLMQKGPTCHGIRRCNYFVNRNVVIGKVF